jgi:Spy/CpxP family protein refolding chaperone
MKRALSFLSLGGLLVCAALRAQTPGGQQPPAAPPPQDAPSQPAAGTPTQPPAATPEAGAPLSKLGLSDEQKKQIHNIRKEAQQQVQAVHNNTSLTQQQQAQQVRQIHHSSAQQVDGVLTPEQRAQYDAYRKAQRRPHHPPAGKAA